MGKCLLSALHFLTRLGRHRESLLSASLAARPCALVLVLLALTGGQTRVVEATSYTPATTSKVSDAINPDSMASSITGTVTLADGVTPVQAARVGIYNLDRSVVLNIATDSNGVFQFSGLAAGIYFVHANPPTGSAYSASTSKKVVVTSGATLNAGILELTSPCVTGVVTDPSGTPVPGAGITYYSDNPSNPLREGAGVNGSGRFGIGGLAAGTYFLQANPPSNSSYVRSRPVSTTVVISGASCVSTDLGNLTLRNAGIMGRVLDTTGTPTAGASVTISKTDYATVVRAQTNALGVFRSLPVPSGDYVVTAFPPAGSDLWSSTPITITGVVSGTTFNTGDISLTSLSLKGRVLLPDSTPAPQGSVHIYDSTGNTDKYAQANDSGIFRLGGLAPGSYSAALVLPSDSGGIIAPAPLTFTVALSQTTDLGDIAYLAASKHVTGTVVMKNGDGSTSPVAGAIVYANNQDGSTHARTKTATDGSFTLDIGGGTWLVGVSPDRSSGAPVPNWVYNEPPVTVTFLNDTSQESKTLNFAATAVGSTVAGTIRLPDSTTPAAGTVSVGIHDDSGFSTSATVASDGSFTLRAPAGSYHMYVHPKDPSLAAPSLPAFSLGSSENKSMGTITLLAKSSYISGRVADGTGQGISGVDVQAWVKGGGEIASTSTITDGVYSLPVISGTWDVQARPDTDSGYIETSPAQELTVADNQTQTADFTLLATDASIYGKVVDAGLTVISAFQGYAYAVQDNTGTVSTPMGGAPVKNGIFVLNLPSGNNYRVAVVCPAGCTYTIPEVRSISLASGEDRQLEVTAQGADSAITGTVMDDTGSQVQDMRGIVQAISPLGMRRTDVGATGSYTMTVNSGKWRMDLWTDPTSGYVWEHHPVSVTTSTGVTSTVNLTVTQATSVITGTVTDPSGTPLDGAWVWAEEPGASTTPPEFVRGDTTKNGGQYSIPLPSDRSFLIRASVSQDKGHISPEAVLITVTTPISLSQDLQFRQPDAQIQGVASLNGSPQSAFVRAWASKGGFATANAGADGTYTLNVTGSDTWRLDAVSDAGGNFYRSAPVTVTVGSTSPVTQNLALAQVGTIPAPMSTSFDASQSQVINLSDGTQLIIPGGALAISGTVTVVATPKFGVAAQKGAEPLGLGYDFSAVDSDGNPITTFLQPVTVVIKYTDAQLAAMGITADQVVAKYWDSTTSTWKTPDNVIQDKDNDTLTISTNHFTVFAGIGASETATANTNNEVFLPFVSKGFGSGW